MLETSNSRCPIRELELVLINRQERLEARQERFEIVVQNSSGTNRVRHPPGTPTPAALQIQSAEYESLDPQFRDRARQIMGEGHDVKVKLENSSQTKCLKCSLAPFLQHPAIRLRYLGRERHFMTSSGIAFAMIGILGRKAMPPQTEKDNTDKHAGSHALQT